MSATRYVTIREMQAIDRRTMESGVPARTLMENAGAAVAREICALRTTGRVLVCAGYGNNGGDGLVAARLLMQAGFRIATLLAGAPRPFRPEADHHYHRLLAAGGCPRAAADIHALTVFFNREPAPDIVIDAIFGIGFRGPLPDFHRELCARVNRCGRQGAVVVAVDVPSGLNADTGKPAAECVRADRTVTMGYPKTGFQNPEAAPFLGQVTVADIGLLPPPEGWGLKLPGDEAHQ